MDLMTYIYIAYGLIAVLLILIIALHASNRRLAKRYRIFSRNHEDILDRLVYKRIKKVDDFNALKAFSKRGIVRYDSYEDIKGRLSFSLCLLDYTNTGFILTSIHNSESCYVYLKEVMEGQTFNLLSEEEREALNMAMGIVVISEENDISI